MKNIHPDRLVRIPQCENINMNSLSRYVTEQEGGMALDRSPEMYDSRFKRTHCHRTKTILVKLNYSLDNTTKEISEAYQNSS